MRRKHQIYWKIQQVISIEFCPGNGYETADGLSQREMIDKQRINFKCPSVMSSLYSKEVKIRRC